MEPLTHSQSAPSLHTQYHRATPDHLQRQPISRNSNSFDFHKGTRKRRRQRPGLNSEILMPTKSSSLPLSSTSSSALDITVAPENTKLSAAHTSSPSPTSAPSSKIRTTSSNQEPSVQQNHFNAIDEHHAEVNSQPGILIDTSRSAKTVEIENSTPNYNEKIPKSSFRRTSSSRSALSLVFDISQNETISRSDSFSSRCESRQGKFHTECTPVEDPNLKIENRGRIRSALGQRSRSSIPSRPGSEVSLLGRRESVTNLIFSGPSTIDGEDGREAVYLKKLQFQSSSRSSLLFSRMASSLKGYEVTPGEFDVMVDEDYSVSRQSKTNSPRSSEETFLPRGRTNFLYQVMDFDRLSKDVPPFVKNYAQKNSKMITETFILRLNYLRRRRQLGEVSSTININSGGGGHSHGPINNNNAKRSSPTAS